MFELGDHVRIIDYGMTYSTYGEWARITGMTTYKGGHAVSLVVNGALGQIIKKRVHTTPEEAVIQGHGDNTMIYGVSTNNGDFIIGEKGLEFVSRPTFLDEDLFTV